jgi:hypothetical protein
MNPEVGYWLRVCLVIGLHLLQAFDGISYFIAVDNFIADAAHQEQIVVPVPLFLRLLRVVARPSRACGFDVTHIPYEGLADGDRIRACRERTAIAGFGVQQVVSLGDGLEGPSFGAFMMRFRHFT